MKLRVRVWKPSLLSMVSMKRRSPGLFRMAKISLGEWR